MRQDPLTKTFDLRTHIRDPKSGKTIKEQPYLCHESKEYGVFYEADGKFYNRKGEDIEDPRIPHAEQVAKRMAAQASPKEEAKEVVEEVSAKVFKKKKVKAEPVYSHDE